MEHKTRIKGNVHYVGVKGCGHCPMEFHITLI